MGEAADLYAVVGHPVGHSKSPLIHRCFARQTGQHIDYVRIDIPPGQFEERLRDFHARGGLGVNVTLPYKLEAFEFADRLTGRARSAGAVNTLAWRTDGIVLGDNTDGAGLVADLENNLGVALLGRRILVLGAGGAARGALGPLLERGPSGLVIANRTVEKAITLADQFGAAGNVSASAFDALTGRFDIVVNATSASLAGELPPVPETVVDAETVCYDMMYGKGRTVFLQWASERGAAVLADGAGMLVEQAAESFELWRGVRPDTGAALAEIRALLC
jgi:shikimate dehydrogenase